MCTVYTYTLLVAYNICYVGKTERNPELYSTETVFKNVRRSSLISDIRFKIRNLKYFERIKCMFSYSSRVGRDGIIARDRLIRGRFYIIITCRMSRLLWRWQQENFKLQFSNLRTNKRARSRITFSYIHFLPMANNS